MSARKKCQLSGATNISDVPNPKPIDWTLCCLCQSTKTEKLICPAKSLKSNACAGYKTLEDNLVLFQRIGKQPVPVNISLLNEGFGISQTLEQHEAVYHNSCRLNCSSSRLARAESTLSTADDINKGSSSTSHYIRPRTLNTYACEVEAISKCFFCDEPESKHNILHDVMMPKVTERVKRCAIELEDQKLIAKLSCGDLVAQDARYHRNCLTKLYISHSKSTAEKQGNNFNGFLYGTALAQLVGFIEETRQNNKDVIPVFRLADLVRLYSNRLEDLGLEETNRIHSTDLKNRLLANVPGLQAYKQGRDVMLTFDSDVGTALKEATYSDYDDEALCLAKAAQIVRRDMQLKSSTFSGTFESNCQEESVPESLLSLVDMIMEGTNIKNKSPKNYQSALSVAQILQFNSLTKRGNSATAMYHNKDKETPLPVYVGLLIHGRTRKRELVDIFFQLGLSISYDRVLDISTSIAKEAIAQYENDGVVCPLILRKNLFTTAAIDNIDHNPTSNTAGESFHGTGISLFQNRANESDGTKRERQSDTTETTQKFSLPDYYTNVAPVSLVTKQPVLQPPDVVHAVPDNVLESAIADEHIWLEKTRTKQGEVQSIDDPVSWAAYHGTLQTEIRAPSINVLLPLFPDDSKSIGMIRHSMDIVREAVKFLNPGQVPVVALDQPLFAIAKLIQWNWPDVYGENKFVVLLGGLHIEMAFLSTIGDFVDGSGWTNILAEAGVTTPGKADALLKSSHVKRARYAHTITCSALWTLLHQAFNAYKEEEPEPLSFEDWCIKQRGSYPQFNYWYCVWKLELLLLIFIRSLREGNFQLYLSSLSALAPWFFALDHTHYSRWLPVHIQDMMTLHGRVPDVEEQFSQGKFVVRKTSRPFSAISVDQAHEQNNAIVKGTAGVTDLMQSPKAMLRWMVAGPEMARAITEFDTNCMVSSKKGAQQERHHEHTLSFQTLFARDMNALVETIDSYGNPFKEETSELLVLDTRDVVDPEISQSICEIEKIGQLQYKEFTKERLIEATKSVADPIIRNNLPLFASRPVKNATKSKSLVSSLE